MFEDLDSEESGKQQFNHFRSVCADTILYALQISNKEWIDKDPSDIRSKVLEIVHEVISSVVGNRDMSNCKFEESDYDLVFVATMRKALEMAEGPPIAE